jgi:hypothetical protein
LNNIGLSKNEGCPKMMDAKKSSFNGKVMIDRWSTIKFRSHLLNLGLGHQKQRRLGAGSIHPVGNHPCSLGLRTTFGIISITVSLIHFHQAWRRLTSKTVVGDKVSKAMPTGYGGQLR